MPSELDFKYFIESDFVNFEDINDNFRKIDNCFIIKNKGITDLSSNISHGPVIPWQYEVFSNGMIRFTSDFKLKNTILCNNLIASSRYITDPFSIPIPQSLSLNNGSTTIVTKIDIDKPFDIKIIPRLSFDNNTNPSEILNLFYTHIGSVGENSISLCLSSLLTESTYVEKFLNVTIFGTLKDES